MYQLLCEADASKRRGQRSRMGSAPQLDTGKTRKTAGRARATGRRVTGHAAGSGEVPPDPRRTNVQVKPGLQLNIEIHLSADMPVDKIEQVFASMAKHLHITDA